MHKIYTNCTENIYQEFEESKSDEQSDPSQKYCDLFSHLVNDCGNIWNYCHNSAEVMDMKEMQIMSFYNYYDAFYVDTCDIVKQYNNKPFARPEKCSEEEQISAQNLFQKCSHQISSNVYENIQNMTREGMITMSLCKAMEEIEESCSKYLTQCLSNKDSSHILQPHLKNIRHFFNSFLQDMIPNARFTGCKDLSFRVSKELTTSNLDRSKEKKNDQIYSQTTVETKSKRIDEKVKSPNLLNYLDTVYNTHLRTFDMNQDTKHDSNQSNTATQEETDTLEPDISKTQTLDLPAEIKDSDNLKLDKKEVLSPDILDTDTDQREMSEVNQKTNEAIKSSDSRTTKSEISNVVVDNISNKVDKITVEDQGSHQINQNKSKEENLSIVANRDSLISTNNSVLLKETPRSNEKQDRSSSKHSLHQKKNKENEKEKDIKNSSDYLDEDVEERGFEKDQHFTNNSEADDKRDFSSQQIQPQAEITTLGRNETENEFQAEVVGKGSLDTTQNHGDGETGVIEKNPNKNLSEPDGQYGWTNWDTTDQKIVIPSNTQENNGNAAVPYMNILIQEDHPSNDKLVLPAPTDPKMNENATEIPTPRDNSSSSDKLFTNVLFVLSTLGINFLINAV